MSRLLYLDCPSGIAGDMLLAALLDAGGQLEPLCEQLRQLPLEHWQLHCSSVSKNGIAARRVSVEFSHQHHHRHYREIRGMIEQTSWPQRARQRALESFRVLAEAEGQVHQCPAEEVHFHEVGAVDSLIDICGAALLLEQLDIGQIYFSALPLSSGTVRCEHGVIPLPAPAAALLMRGLELLPSPLNGETVTPTGIALLRGCRAEQSLPPLRLLEIGCGAGSRDFEQQPNILRALLGEPLNSGDLLADLQQDQVEVLRSNIDDASGELLAQLWAQAQAAGALDMSYTPLLMKKGRPGWALELIVPDGQSERFARLIFRESCTIGLRVSHERRWLLPRHSETVATAFGEIAVKISGDTVAPEADAVAAAAAAHQTSFKTVYQAALAAYWQQRDRCEPLSSSAWQTGGKD